MEIRDNLCRTCFKTQPQLFSLNVKFEDEVQGKKMLQFILGTEILEREDFSQICGECMKNLSVSYHFKKQCLASEEKIKEQIDLSEDLPDPEVVIFESTSHSVSPKDENSCTMFTDKKSPEKSNVRKTKTEKSSEVTGKSVVLRKGKNNQKSGCQRCGIKFSDWASYMRHYRREHLAKKQTLQMTAENEEKKEIKDDKGKPKNCLRCEISFPDNVAYRKHYRTNHDKSPSDPMTCTRCQITFPNAAAYHRHYKELHMKKEKGSKRLQEGTVPEKPKYCRTCKITFINVAEYMKHYRREHEKRREIEEVPKNQDWKIGPNGEKLIGCYRCKTTFPDMLEYGRHYRLLHEMKKPRTRETTVCEECGKTIPLHRIKIHRASHGGKTFFCSICDSGFTLKHNLKHHMRIHSKEKKYFCHYCGKDFIHWSSRRDHVRNTHEADMHQKIFECHICGKKCTRKSNMASHLLKHTGAFKHECTVCCKKFISAHELKRHMITHTGEKNVICPVCSKAFGTKGCLRQHMVTHTRERNYECEICSKTFTQCHVLRSHIRATHPDQPLPPPGTILKKVRRTEVPSQKIKEEKLLER